LTFRLPIGYDEKDMDEKRTTKGPHPPDAFMSIEELAAIGRSGFFYCF
jgi:hypothetical protein